MSTTNKVTFSIDNVELLYSIPRPGGDLATIVRAFVFLNRSTSPAFSLLQECFTKALQAGILTATDGNYQVQPDWYERIHRFDESAGNEIESMLEFQDEFVGEEVPLVTSAKFSFTEEDYNAIVRGIQQ